LGRERALKVVLVVVGFLFVAAAWPMMVFVKQEPGLAMLMCLYATLGVFVLLAARNPAEHRSLIAFTAWSSLAHAVFMGTQALLNFVQRGELVGVGVLAVIGVALIWLAPGRQDG
jgi:tryptophan-rich sensory protein